MYCNKQQTIRGIIMATLTQMENFENKVMELGTRARATGIRGYQLITSVPSDPFIRNCVRQSMEMLASQYGLHFDGFSTTGRPEFINEDE
jgi:hypothetical protein